jgi:hypothetical protein
MAALSAMSQLLSAASDKRVTSAMRGDIDLLYMDCPARKPGGIKEKRPGTFGAQPCDHY